MDWNLAIEKNTQALTQIVAGLFVLVGCSPPSVIPDATAIRDPLMPSSHEESCSVPKSQPQWIPVSMGTGMTNWKDHTLGPITRRHLVSVLRTAEAALRRLIVLFVKVHGVKAIVKMECTRPLPDFSTFNRNGDGRTPVFNLFDPRKRMVFGFDEGEDDNPVNSSPSDLTTPSSSDLIGGSMHEPRIMFPHTHSVSLGVDPRVKPEDDDGVGSADRLLKRLAALDHALKTIPQQAKRLVRVMAQREKAPAGIRRIPPIRPGIPPCFRDRGKHEVDDVLRECHGLMKDIQSCPP